MKKLFFLLILLITMSFCSQQNENIQMETAAAPERTLTEKEYLIGAKVISDTEYQIICKAYPRPGLTDEIQMAGTAKEAALIYAQITAKKRLKNIDPTKGTIKEYKFDGEFGTVYYIIEAENIRSHVK
ncbi:MAG: hypothetical protein JW982_00290 [Spirochaetes bacterium]|nr:hypothetical protein [Spirochaetota bacterium]